MLEKVYPEVSSLVTEEEFDLLYSHATQEPYNAFVIDNHPKMDKNKRFRMNYDIVLSITGHQ